MEQTYCLTPAEWRYAQGCLTLAKRLGLIEDDTPAALEKRRAAKNAAAPAVRQTARRCTACAIILRPPTCSMS